MNKSLWLGTCAAMAVATCATLASPCQAQDLQSANPANIDTPTTDTPQSGTNPAAASVDDGTDSGDIIVTATRAEANVSKVPISITAFSKTRLDNLGARNIEDLVRLTPGVNLERVRARASGTNIAIRGISSRIGAGTTGVYIDDAPIQTRIIGYDATNAYPAIFDLERVEVLRGPQGTLFGSGSMGGTIRFITPQPSLTQTSVYGRAEFSSTAGGDPSYEAGVAVGTPIIEGKLGIRMSAWYRKDGGWVDRANGFTGVTTQKNINDGSTKVFRAALTYAPVEGLTITPSVFYQDLRISDSGAYWSTLSNPGDGVLRTGLPRRQPVIDRISLPSLKIDYEIGGVTLTSSTAYLDRDANTTWDYSTVVPAILSKNKYLQLANYQASSVFSDRQRNFTQEFRIAGGGAGARLTWVAGLFYGHLKQNAIQSVDAQYIDNLSQAIYGKPAAQVLGPNVNAGDLGPSALYILSNSLDEQTAVFGEATFEIVPKLKLTAGLRYSRTKLTFDNAQSGPFNGPASSVRNEQKANPLTPRFSVAYQASDTDMVYATVSKGFRIGGGNASLPSTTCSSELASIGIPAAPQTYDADSLWNYEVGAKGRLFGALQINASAFYIKWKNIQQQVFLKCAFQYVDNVGGATSKGFDLQASLRFSPSFSLGASVGYVDATYDGNAYPGPVAGSGPKSVIVSDGDSVGVQPWNVTLTADYDASIGGNRSVYANATLVYRSHDKGQTAFLNPLSVAYDRDRVSPDASTIVNVRAGVRFGEVDVSIFAKNLTNSTALLSRNHDTADNPIFQESTYQPRTIGFGVFFRY